MDVPEIWNKIETEYRCEAIRIDGHGDSTEPEQDPNVRQNDCVMLVGCKHHRLRVEV